MKDYPTNRKYVSFSEIKTWAECTFRHWLLYVEGSREDSNTVYTDFGTIAHDANENYLKTRSMDVDGAIEKLREVWNRRGYPNVPKALCEHPNVKHGKRTYRLSDILGCPDDWPSYADPEWQYWEDNLRDSLEAIPKFLDTEFPEWEFIEAESELDEVIKGQSLKFRGYIDAIIKVKSKQGKDVYWVLDWKTAPARGWDKQKRQNFFITMQVVLYKHFWSVKSGVPIKDIRCGYVLMKRDAKKKRCQLLTISAGPKTIAKALKWTSSMIKMVEEKRVLKNRYSCTYCEFKDTEQCKLNL